MAIPVELDSAQADELFEMLNGELAYIRPASTQALRTTTTAVTSTPSAHAAVLPIRMLSPLLALPVAMICRANFSLIYWSLRLGAMLQTMRRVAARPMKPLCRCG